MMGDRERAKKAWSIGGDVIGLIAFNLLDKCGNCNHRLACLDEYLFTPKGTTPFKLFDAMLAHCADESRVLPGVVARKGADVIHGLCGAPCVSLPGCVEVAMRRWVVGSDKTQKYIDGARKCVSCPSLALCIQESMDRAGISTVTFIGAYLKMARGCRGKNPKNVRFLE